MKNPRFLRLAKFGEPFFCLLASCLRRFCSPTGCCFGPIGMGASRPLCPLCRADAVVRWRKPNQKAGAQKRQPEKKLFCFSIYLVYL